MEDDEDNESMETQIALVQDFINRSSELNYVDAEKFTSASLICKVFYGKMKAQWGKYTLLLNLL